MWSTGVSAGTGIAALTDDTLFLTHTSDGWKVMAAACRLEAEDQPYDCQLEGS